MIDAIGEIFLEVICYGTGEYIVRCFPQRWVRSEIIQKPKSVEVDVRGKRKKFGKYAYHRHIKRTSQSIGSKAWVKSPDGAVVLGGDVIGFIGLVFWITIVALGFFLASILRA